MAKPIK
jgi:hypothetical protein